MSVLIGANFFALYSTVLNENNTAEETQSADSIYQHPDNIPSKTLDFLIANIQADIPQKILFIQTQKTWTVSFSCGILVWTRLYFQTTHTFSWSVLYIPHILIHN